MKKIMLGFAGVLGLLGVGFATKVVQPRALSVAAEEIVEPAVCTVELEKVEHGKISVDKTEGTVGETVTINVEPKIFYVVESVTVNGTSLVESKETKGVYTFVLSEGENKVSAKLVIDEETFGIFTDMVKEAEAKDWKNLFSVKNIISIVGWVLNGGLLIAMVRYFIKDKRLESKVETATKESIEKIIPDSTKTTVVETIEKVITPIVSNLNSKMVDIEKAMTTFSKCMALAQENTSESRKAIIDELSGLNLGDSETLNQVKEYIEKMVKEALDAQQETLKMIENIKASNQQIIEKEHSKDEKQKGENGTYDGTTI